ncbi:oxidase EvaA [Haloactinopolyspora alba]|uniref:Oxidase EvaA n=1 Tax=Haloactinopolyspora alba TaxID=648780 RepID=A0A2P8E918_9ACTN|nr:NDP-hexose 2,3-dehydratase family protein [Haloactinopolyspora alba]PSL05981.1 oxidase EvaA [Haloactinopolyspora alba]
MTTSSSVAESVLAPVDPELAEFDRYVETAREHIYTRVQPMPLESLDSWYTDPDTGWIRHRSGKFFSIEGLRFTVSDGPVPEWCQPIINQPEIGILGVLVKEFDGVVHCLLQLKAEPGNRGGLQLSPTVQATRSNYTGAHGGGAVPLLEYFRDAPAHRVLADVRQSEQGASFLRKRNRNMIVATADDVPDRDGFRWLTVPQVLRLLRRDDLVNMDTRTVLSLLPFAAAALRRRNGGRAEAWTRTLLRSCDRAASSVHPDRELQAWVTDVRTRTDVSATPVSMASLHGWQRADGTIRHETRRFFDVIGVGVESAGREVARWTQPMLTAGEDGVLGWLVRRIDGVLHALVRMRVEPGLVDVAEIAPTVQCIPGNYAHLPPAAHPPFLDEVLNARPERVLFDTMLSDEGGRFYGISNRHLIVETDAVHNHPDYRWVSVGQLVDLLRHSHYLNVQARSLLVCLYGLLLDPADG